MKPEDMDSAALQETAREWLNELVRRLVKRVEEEFKNSAGVGAATAKALVAAEKANLEMLSLRHEVVHFRRCIEELEIRWRDDTLVLWDAIKKKNADTDPFREQVLTAYNRLKVDGSNAGTIAILLHDALFPPKNS